MNLKKNKYTYVYDYKDKKKSSKLMNKIFT